MSELHERVRDLLDWQENVPLFGMALNAPMPVMAADETVFMEQLAVLTADGDVLWHLNDKAEAMVNRVWEAYLPEEISRSYRYQRQSPEGQGMMAVRAFLRGRAKLEIPVPGGGSHKADSKPPCTSCGKAKQTAAGVPAAKKPCDTCMKIRTKVKRTLRGLVGL